MEKEVFVYNQLYQDIFGDFFAILLITPLILLVFWYIFKVTKLYGFGIPLIVFLVMGFYVVIRNTYQSISNPVLYTEGKIDKRYKSRSLLVWINGIRFSISKQTAFEPGFHDTDFEFKDSLIYKISYKEIGYHNLIFEIYEK